MSEINNENNQVQEEVKEEVAAAKDETTTEKTFTQAEVDELLKKRIAREAKKYEKKLTEASKPTEDQTSLEDENNNLKNTISGLNKQILNYEAAKLAAEANVKPERIDAFLRLADFSEITLDDNGTYKDEIKDVISEVAKDFPEFLKSEEKKEQQGFIKVGTAPEKATDADKLKEQIFKGMGLL